MGKRGADAEEGKSAPPLTLLRSVHAEAAPLYSPFTGIGEIVMPMTGPPPTTIRVVSHEGISQTKVRIMLEMIVDVHRLAEVGQDFLHTAIEHIDVKKPKPRR